jgi:hypothetical protein
MMSETPADRAANVIADIERARRLYPHNPDYVLRDMTVDLVEQHLVKFKRAIRAEYSTE